MIHHHEGGFSFLSAVTSSLPNLCVLLEMGGHLLSLLLASGMHQKLLYSNESTKVRPFSPLKNSAGWR